MELQALLVLCGVGVAGFAVLLLMGLFSTSGTSYEEAIAQQRKATSELLALADNKNKSKKTNKKANKKLAKKEKNKEHAAATGSEVDSEAPAESGVEDESVPVKPHVEFSPPVFMELAADEPPPLIKIRKRGKDPKVKPILINKEDPSCVSDPGSATTINVTNNFEEMHPKDELELMQSSLGGEKVVEKKEEVVEKKEKSKQGKPKMAPKPAPVEAPKEEAPRDRSIEAPMEQRKAKKVEKKSAIDASAEEVVPPLNAPQPSELTTEKLLKQALAPPAPSPPAGKNKKKKTEPNVLSLIAAEGGVAVGELVRVVREASLSRTELQILTDALLDRHHEPLPQHGDWSEGPNDPMAKLKKQLADKEKTLADEMEASKALHAKLKELRTNLNAERARCAALSRASEQAEAGARAELHTLQARLQRLLDDNRALAQDNLMLKTKLSEDSEAQAQRVQMEMHIQRLSEAEASLVGQLGALQAELSARALDAGLAQQHAAELAQQLQEANRACSELEQQRACAVHAEQLVQQELRAAHDHCAELKNEIQRLTSRSQLAETAADKLKDDLEKQKAEAAKELSSLREQLAAAESELAELRALKSAPAQNGLPPANDDFKAAELSKVESVVEALREELAAAQRSSAEQQAQLAQLREQLAHHQRKNDEAITKAKESQLMEVVSMLSAACPDAAPSCPPGGAWIWTFADNVNAVVRMREGEMKKLEAKLLSKLSETESQKNNLETELAKKQIEGEVQKNEMQRKLQEQEQARKKLETELKKRIEESEIVSKKLLSANTSEDTNSRVSDLLSQNKSLQTLVDKYKRVIDDTEGVLSRLQQNVTREEQRWQQQLRDQQRELELLQQTTVQQLQKKIDILESELKQAQKQNHVNSFADAERIAQEKLLSVGLTEKFDVSNGPLSVTGK